MSIPLRNEKVVVFVCTIKVFDNEFNPYPIPTLRSCERYDELVGELVGELVDELNELVKEI